MKANLYLTVFLFVLINFLFCVSSRNVFAQTNENQHKRILFVNRNDENVAVVHPRTFKNPIEKEIPDNKPTETNSPKAAVNFSYEKQVFEFINKKRSNSPTINEHLGDVHQKQGKAELAKSAWQKALNLTSDMDEISRLKTKLNSKVLK